MIIARAPLQGGNIVFVSFAAIACFGMLITFFDQPMENESSPGTLLRLPANWSAFLAILLSVPYLVDAAVLGQGWGTGIFGAVLVAVAFLQLLAARGVFLSAVWGFLLGQVGTRVYSAIASPPSMSPLFWACLFCFAVVGMVLSFYSALGNVFVKERS